jgi:hypothetical protein
MNDPELKGFASVRFNTAYNEVEDNLISFFDWGLLNKENFYTIQKDQTLSSLINEYSPEPFDFAATKSVKLNTDMSLMKPSNITNVTKGVLWEGIYDNWVWESGVDTYVKPIIASGVYVQDVFYPSSGTTGQYEHFIDYNNGRVVFKNPVSLTSKVQVEHSFKWINVCGSNVLDSIRLINEKSQPFTYRTPLVCIEVPNRSQSGLQLGGGQILKFDVIFFCFATSDNMCNRIMDIIGFQNDRTIQFYNKNFIVENNDFPFLDNGKLRGNAKNYNQLIYLYPGYKAQLYNANLIKSNFSSNLFKSGVVKMNLDLRKLNI